MKIQINTYGGILGWVAHKYFSGFLINKWLKIQEHNRLKSTTEYVKYFIRQDVPPLFEMVEIETINRCNGECSFCPANKNEDKRPYKKMEKEVFEKIILELKDIDYQGEVLLEVNNEPLLDVRLTEFAKFVKKNLPECSLQIITNGTLLTKEKLNELAPYMDKIVINNYSERYLLNKNIKNVYLYAKNNLKHYNTEIEIRRRYVKEVLTNRAGTAPNKRKAADICIPCLYPFVGVTIFSNGNVGLCSNDCFEQTNFGNVAEERLLNIWNGQEMKKMREAISQGRKKYSFCKACDVIGIGTREKIASDEMGE